jgi:hypothetical protein
MVQFKDKIGFTDFPEIGGVMTTKMISEQKKKALFMYREKPSRNEDSGWRIFSGYEDESYTNDPGNSAIYNATTILRIDPSIAELLLHPVGSVFERENENSAWTAVDDFDFDNDQLERQQLPGNWSIEMSNLFVAHKEEESGDHVFVMKGRTIRISLFHFKGKTQRELQDIYSQEGSGALQRFDISDKVIVKIGYMREEHDQKKYNVIYGSSIVNGSLLLSVFYFDKDADKAWAIDTWRSISYSST